MTIRKSTKRCNKCYIEKDLTEFGEKVTAKSGKQIWCKDCTNVYYREWRRKNPEKSKPLEANQFRKFYSTVNGRATHMLNNLRSRARRNDIEVTLDIDWIKYKLLNGVCEITNIPFILKENNGKGHRNNSFSPSIDRIDPIGPYSPENCQMTCWLYNRAKGAFPLEDLYQVMEALISRTNPDLS